MERIKKALELAREARKSAQGENVSPSPRPVADHGRGLDNQIGARNLEVSPDVLEHNRVIAGLQDNEFVAPYKLLRTQVVHRLREHGWQSVAVTGPSMGVGKTLTAVNLAVSLARSANYWVFLLDLDLARPAVHTLFGYEPKYDVADHLVRSVPLEKVAFSPGIERLTVIPCNRGHENSSELLSSHQMQRLITELKENNPARIVVCDLPPLLVSDDVLAFSPFVDSLLLVVEDGKTTRDDLARALELIKNENFLGAVLNKSNDFVVSNYRYYDYK